MKKLQQVWSVSEEITINEITKERDYYGKEYEYENERNVLAVLQYFPTKEEAIEYIKEQYGGTYIVSEAYEILEEEEQD